MEIVHWRFLNIPLLITKSIKMKTRLFSLVVLFASMLFASCSQTEEEIVKDLALEYYQDFKKGNFSSMKEYVTENSRDPLIIMVKKGELPDGTSNDILISGLQKEMSQFTESVKSVHFDKDSSNVEVILLLKAKNEEEKEYSVYMEKENEKWKVNRSRMHR